jgi:beta-galactosidase
MNRNFFLALGFLFFLAAAGRAAETLPLAGEWRFALDRADAGATEKWFAKNLPDKIRLPGILETQGYGDEISTSTPWVLSLYDRNWFLRKEYAAYTNAGSVKVPFLCQPPRHYLGAAWYQRDIEIPTNWNGKRIVLFLERPKWKSTVWLDDKEIGSDISLCTPHEFDFGPMPAGRHRLTVRVDNRMILPYRPDAHSISDSLGQAWNGIVGKMELRATPPVWIEDATITTQLKDKTILIKGIIGNVSGATGNDVCTIKLWSPYLDHVSSQLLKKDIAVSWTTNGGSLECTLAFPEQAQLWSEFNPSIYAVTIYLNHEQTGTGVIKFGLRDIRTDGHQFILNGRPVYLRGTHFGGDFPLTGAPPTDVESWKKIFQTCKSYGLNHMRFHSWCPPEAAFTAADELGFYLQVECGMWNTFEPDSDITRQLYSETERIIKYYGNHPSLLLVSASNEPKGHWQNVLPEWAAHFRAADPRRLWTTATGFTDKDSPGPVDKVDYSVTGRVGPNRVRGETGWFGRDYQNSLDGINVPVVAHELGQWCAYPDFDVMKKFTGFMQPGNYEIFRDSAAAHSVLEENHEFAQASGKFQLACYKEEIEANLRTPGLAGFQLLDLHDYTGQGTALIGLLDPFWESKGYAPPDEFKKFCNTVVPLAWLPKRVFTTDEKLEADIGLANFGAETLKQTHVMWTVYDQAGKRVAGGFLFGPARDLPVGFKDKLYHFSTRLENLPAPAEYKLVAATTILSTNSSDQGFQNDWNFWLYPAAQPVTPPIPNLIATSSPAAAKQALADGKKVLFTPRLADLSWWSPPLARVPVFWNALMGPTWSRMLGLWCDTNSPALAEFPTGANCDWQWTEIVAKSRAVNLDQLPRGLKPIVSAIDDWNRNYKLGVIFEARVGNGKLLVCSADLNASPVGTQLRRSLEDYMSGEKFQPATEITTAQFDSLFFDNLVMRKLGATATADGKSANEILDGDPNTFWTSADSKGNSAKPPHEIIIAFPQPVPMSGLMLMPRQNHRDHQGDIRDYTLEVSDDGTNWLMFSQGRLASTFDPQDVWFTQILTTKHLKLTALFGFGADKSAALAELAVLYTGPALPENSGKLEYRRGRTASTDIDAGGDAPASGRRKPVQN